MSGKLKFLELYSHLVRHSATRSFLPEIQALRALAVALVVVFHLWPERLTGGFIGVDVFFVISGYLITAHIVREVDKTGTLRVGAFWARRLRRLLPVSLLVLLVSTIAVALVAPYNLWQSFLKSVVASALYVENWVLAADSVNYWAEGQAAPPSQHYWSLSVEEQFYLVWPIIILGTVLVLKRFAKTRSTRNTIAVVMLVLFTASLAYSVFITNESRAAAYFVTPARVWEFALGGLLAMSGREWLRGERLRTMTSWVGVAMIAFAAVVFTGAMPFPGWIALIPALGTALVILAGSPASRWSLTPIAQWGPVQYVGDISYSVYLWHWPLVVLLPWGLGHPLSTRDKVVILVVTFVLAGLTKRFVEDPLRSKPVLMKWRSAPTYVATAAGMAIVVVVATVGMSQQTAWASSASKAVSAALAESGPCFGAAALENSKCGTQSAAGQVPAPALAVQDFDQDIEKCFSQDPNPHVIKCSFGDPSHSRFSLALVGDSHAGAIAPAVRRLTQAEGWHVDVYLKPGCPWSDIRRIRTDGYTAAVANCTGWEHQVTQDLEKTHYDAVLTTSYAVVNNLVQADPGKDSYATAVDRLRSTWESFETKTGTPIVVLRDTPNWPNQSPVDCLLYSRLSHAKCRISRDQAFSVRDPQIPASESIPGVHLIELTDQLCKEDYCSAVVGGVTVYRDPHHLTRTFAITLAPFLRDAIRQALKSERPSR